MGIQFELFVIGYLKLTIAREFSQLCMQALMASLTMFPTVFKTYENHYTNRCFQSIEVLKRRYFLIPKFVIDTPCTIN